MIAIWRFMMLKSQADDQLSARIQAELDNRTFEERNQAERVELLKKFDSLDHETKDAFACLRRLRRTYLHYMVGHDNDPDADARTSLKYASKLVTKTLNVQWDGEGRIIFSPMVMRFIRTLLTPDDD
jgi:hypothetical protein